MTEKRLSLLCDLIEQIKKYDSKISTLKSEDFKMHNIHVTAHHRGDYLRFDEKDTKVTETIHDFLLVYYEKHLRFLKKRFEIL